MPKFDEDFQQKLGDALAQKLGDDRAREIVERVAEETPDLGEKLAAQAEDLGLIRRAGGMAAQLSEVLHQGEMSATANDIGQKLGLSMDEIIELQGASAVVGKGQTRSPFETPSPLIAGGDDADEITPPPGGGKGGRSRN